MNAQSEEVLLEKYRSLPPQRRAEADRFIDFLKASESRAQPVDRLGKAFSKLDALSLPLMSAEEVQAEIDAARSERRVRDQRLRPLE